MSLYYSASTGGFYDTVIHADLFVEHVDTDPSTGETIDRYMVPDPHGAIADAVAVTADEHAALLAAQAQGKLITADATGHPVATDPPPPSTDQLATAARTQRDALLAACDWTQGNDSPLSATDKAAWANYRQALRDVPEQAGFPATITWPSVPAA